MNNEKPKNLNIMYTDVRLLLGSLFLIFVAMGIRSCDFGSKIAAGLFGPDNVKTVCWFCGKDEYSNVDINNTGDNNNLTGVNMNQEQECVLAVCEEPVQNLTVNGPVNTASKNNLQLKEALNADALDKPLKPLNGEPDAYGLVDNVRIDNIDHKGYFRGTSLGTIDIVGTTENGLESGTHPYNVQTSGNICEAFIGKDPFIENFCINGSAELPLKIGDILLCRLDKQNIDYSNCDGLIRTK